MGSEAAILPPGSEAARSLGASAKEFRKGVSEGAEDNAEAQASEAPAEDKPAPETTAPDAQKPD